MTAMRKNRMPKPGLQLRLSLGFVGVASLALLSQVLLLANRLVMLSHEMPAGGEELQKALPGLLTGVAVASFLLLLPCVVVIGVLITFRTAGPIYRFEKYLAEVAAGRDLGPCRIRKGDELQELCTLINAALEARSRAALEPESAPAPAEKLSQAA